jgi:putative FmdB family regulatory protein
MPLYEYECQSCKHHVEAQQKMADTPLKTCPHCGKDELQRIISATAFHLKGGGWYKDLYSSTKPGSESSSSSPSPNPSPSPSSSESKSDSKPEAKSTTAPSPTPSGGSGGSSSS